MKKIIALSLLCLCASSAQGMHTNVAATELWVIMLLKQAELNASDLTDIIHVGLGKEVSAAVPITKECNVVELPESDKQGKLKTPYRHVFARKGDMPENIIVSSLYHANQSALSLLRDRKNTLSSGFKKFRMLGEDKSVILNNCTREKCRVSYEDENNSLKITDIIYVAGPELAFSYEATITVTAGKTIKEACEQLGKNNDKKVVFFLAH